MKSALNRLNLAVICVISVVLSVGCAQNIPPITPIPTVQEATFIAASAPLPSPTPVPDNPELVASVDTASLLPACAPSIPERVSLPDNFAPSFSFPRGILFSSVTVLNDNADYLQVIGYAPLALEEADAFVASALPKAGYELEGDDSEPEDPDRADLTETKFSGNGYRGALRVASIENCPPVTQWTIVVIKESH